MSLLLKKAEALATQAHGTQTRKFDNSPYVGHLLEVKSILEYFKIKDEKVLCAALLHDVLEDTIVTRHEIEQSFGCDVLAMVEELTDDKTMLLADRRNVTIRKLSKQQADIHAIKLADLISNLSALPPMWNDERRKDYFSWCEQLIVASNKAPLKMLQLAEYLLCNQSGKSDDFDGLKRWAEQSNLYWSKEKRALLFVGFSEMGDVEARIMSGEMEVINILFGLGLLRDFLVNSTNLGSVLVVNTLPKSVEPNFDCFYLECFPVDYQIT